MEVIIATSDDGDWTGIYVNGVLKAENHSLRDSDVLKALGIDYQEIEFTYDEMEAMNCHFPKDSGELVRQPCGANQK